MTEKAKLYAILYIVCPSRQPNLAEFFSHKNLENQPSFSECGKIRKRTRKSIISTFVLYLNVIYFPGNKIWWILQILATY